MSLATEATLRVVGCPDSSPTLVASESLSLSIQKSPASAYFLAYELAAPVTCQESIPFLDSSSLA